MSVSGYKLRNICRQQAIPDVMLTARTLTAEDVRKSFQQVAAYFLPEEEMIKTASFLAEIAFSEQTVKQAMI